MTEDFDSVEELLEWIENNFWNFMITVFTMVADARELYKMEQIRKHNETKQTFKIGSETFVKED